MKKILPLLIILTVSVSCELYEQDSYKEYYVVESYLIANNELPEVLLSTTSPIEEEYNFEDVAVSGAEIEIRLLNPDSAAIDTFSYHQYKNGVYRPSTSAIVQDESLYQLHVTTESGEIITSTTFVPGDFDTTDDLRESYVYQSDEQVELTTTPSAYPGRQTYYIFTVNVVNPDPANLTPFYMDAVEDENNEAQDYYINSSGIINQGNYEQDQNGNITLKLPWLAVAFYGSNDIVTNTIDDNMYDFLRSQDVQTGGSTLSPGEIQNIQYNVNGGIGIFGSMASDTSRVLINRPDNQE